MTPHETSEPGVADVLRIAAVVLMAALAGTYFWLNAEKVSYALDQLRTLSGGRPANEITLSLDGRAAARFRFPESDLFDARSARQLNFHRLDEAAFDRLGAAAERVEVALNGARTAAPLQAARGFLHIELPGHRLHLLRGDDLRAMALLIDSHNRSRGDVLACAGEICQAVRLFGTSGIGPVDGPFLDTDLSPLRRGMPRGRWVYGPATRLDFRASMPARAWIEVEVLGLTPDQEIRFVGPVRKVTVTASGQEEVLIGGLPFYLKRYVAEVEFQEGDNQISLQYSRYRAAVRETERRAGYLTLLSIRDAGE